MVDYSSKGCEYAMFVDKYEGGKLIEINSRESLSGVMSSYLGNLWSSAR